MTMLPTPDRLAPARTPRKAPTKESARHLRVVERRRGRKRARLVTACGIGVLFLVLFGAVSFHVHLIQNQQQIDHLTTQSQESQARYNSLRLQVDVLQAPARIVAAATRQGLVGANDSTWLAPSAAVTANSQGPDAPVNQDDRPPDTYSHVKPYLGGTP